MSPFTFRRKKNGLDSFFSTFRSTVCLIGRPLFERTMRGWRSCRRTTYTDSWMSSGCRPMTSKSTCTTKISMSMSSWILKYHCANAWPQILSRKYSSQSWKYNLRRTLTKSSILKIFWHLIIVFDEGERFLIVTWWLDTMWIRDFRCMWHLPRCRAAT